jgi:hypothetical protein
VQWASAVISSAWRFSHYKVKAQQTVYGTTSPAAIWQGVAQWARLAPHRRIGPQRGPTARKLTAPAKAARDHGGKLGRRPDGDAALGCGWRGCH